MVVDHGDLLVYQGTVMLEGFANDTTRF